MLGRLLLVCAAVKLITAVGEAWLSGDNPRDVGNVLEVEKLKSCLNIDLAAQIECDERRTFVTWETFATRSKRRPHFGEVQQAWQRTGLACQAA